MSLKVLVSDRFCLLFIHKICSLNASARLIYCAPKSCHIMPLLLELHWLPVCYRFEYKILLHTFEVLQNVSKSLQKVFRTECSKRKFMFHFFKAIFDTRFMPLLSFLGKWNWFEQMTNAISGQNLAVLHFAYHLPKPSIDWFAHLNGKRNNRSLKQRLCHSRFVLLA